jgi:hypothetical protein
MSKDTASTPQVSRRQLLATSAAAATVSTGAQWTRPARASTLPSIPEVTVSHGVAAYTNHCWTVLAAKKGFLKDVGISLNGGAPKVLRDQQLVPSLQNGEVDITTMYLGLITQALDKVTNVKPILVYSFWQGNTILTSPNLGFKTVDEFLAQGLPWEKAAAAATAQLKGQKFTVTANPSTYPWIDFALGLGGLSMKDTQAVPIEDPKAVQLAINDQVPFAAPGGAVQIYQLQYQANWKPVISTRQMVKYMTGGPGSALNNLLNYDVMQTTSAYLDKNRSTVLRWCAAMYRTLDYVFGPQQVQAFTEYAPFINANTGAEMDPKSIKFIFEVLDPFFQWKDQAAVWEDPNYPLYYKNIYDFQIKKYIANGTLPNQQYDLEALFQAKPIFLEMRELKGKAEMLTQKLQNSGNVAAERAELAKLGKAQYDAFNYLDAVRFLEAATA